MVVLLAVIGAIVVGRFALHAITSSGRVLKAANRFQAPASEVIRAVNEAPNNEIGHLKAIAAWEDARRFIGTLSAAEQRLAAQTLLDRGFPTAEIGRAIEAHVAARNTDRDALDDDLKGMVAAQG